MAIVKNYSTVFGASADGIRQVPNSASRHGRVMVVAGKVTCLATDNLGSIYLLAPIPSSAIILPATLIKGDAWGFAQFVVGIEGAVDQLLDITTVSALTAGDPILAAFDAKWNKPVWEQAGLAADPMTPLNLMLTAEADATGAGQVDFDLHIANHV